MGRFGLACVAVVGLAAFASASEPKPPERLQQYRESGNRVLVLAMVRDREMIVTNPHWFAYRPVEHFSINVSSIAWSTVADGALDSVKVGSDIEVVNKPGKKGDHGAAYGSISTGEPTWFVLQPGVGEDPPDVIAAASTHEADDARPPDSLAHFRDDDNRALIRCVVQDVERTTVNRDRIPAESVRIEIVDVLWDTDPNALRGVVCGAQKKILFTPSRHADCPPLGSLVVDRKYWFVLKGQSFGDPPTTIAAVAVAGQEAASTPALEPFDGAPPERLARYRNGEHRALVVGEVRDVAKHVARPTPPRINLVHVEHVRIKLLANPIVAVSPAGLHEVQCGDVIKIINRDDTLGADQPSLGSIAIGSTYWFAIDARSESEPPLLIAIAPVADRDAVRAPERLDRFRGTMDQALLLGTVRNTERATHDDGVGVAGPTERIKVDVKSVAWNSTPTRGLRDLRVGEAAWLTNSPGPWSIDNLPFGTILVDQTYWFLLENGDGPSIIAVEEVR